MHTHDLGVVDYNVIVAPGQSVVVAVRNAVIIIGPLIDSAAAVCGKQSAGGYLCNRSRALPAASVAVKALLRMIGIVKKLRRQQSHVLIRIYVILCKISSHFHFPFGVAGVKDLPVSGFIISRRTQAVLNKSTMG